VLRQSDLPGAPELVLGAGEADDAAVWRLDDERALVGTVDVITPIVDDARAWGRIAAANAASDVYATGGRPLFGLNVVCWNADELSDELLGQVLAGASEAAREGRFALAGGHTLTDPVPKFGLAVIGEVAPAAVTRRQGLRPGDALVLTKPLGTGIVATAIKQGAAPETVVEVINNVNLGVQVQGAFSIEGRPFSRSKAAFALKKE